jgi:hypothetical protein
MATLANVIAARIFRAEHADHARGLPANRASERGYFHQYFFFFELEEGASLLIIPRQRCASSSAILKFCSVLAARSC